MSLFECRVSILLKFFFFLFFKQKTAYEMRISDWSSDVCSSDLITDIDAGNLNARRLEMIRAVVQRLGRDGGEHADQPVRRVVGEVRIGDVPLRAMRGQPAVHAAAAADRKSTRLNSSH